MEAVKKQFGHYFREKARDFLFRAGESLLSLGRFVAHIFSNRLRWPVLGCVFCICKGGTGDSFLIRRGW